MRPVAVHACCGRITPGPSAVPVHDCTQSVHAPQRFKRLISIGGILMARVIRMHDYGGPSVLRVETSDTGEPGPGQVLLRQYAIGVNAVDAIMREGQFGTPLPAVLGVEGAGVIQSVGPGVKRHSPGDRVGYFFSMGAYSTERLIAAESLIPIPEDIGTDQAAAFLAKGLTAWMGIRALHHVRPGEVILVQGASGGVGSILSRWAKDMGATVIGVAGSKEKSPQVRAGSDHALHAADPDFLGAVREVAANGVDVVYDLVGQATAELSAQAVRDGGTIVTIGAASGPPRHYASLQGKRGIRLVGGSTPQYVDPSTDHKTISELFAAIRGGLFNDLKISRYAFEEARQAHEDLKQRKLSGLPILKEVNQPV
ncbi:zinc-binding dehydrogenase [Planotetraspora phitsanulokensis]|uniref:zinc-binding dehydrogenase n=1 Tax=Planotetraspora phitsanulokensis TaxID=575192 RepID=UPI00195057F4|nr:zinc-binding dehydrogenase [Planotetraspora phitsanulokensis]